MKKQKHWHLEEEILQAIEMEKEKQRELCVEGEKLSAKATALFSSGFEYDARLAKDDSEKRLAKASRKETTLEKLKLTLAAFRTKPMAFMDDSSVTTQGVQKG